MGAQGDIFLGDSVQVFWLEDGIAELVFDNKKSSVNKFDRATLQELSAAVTKLIEQKALHGLLIRSAKDVFIVGADVTEFLGYFKASDAELTSWLTETHRIFAAFEDLHVPTVCAINGICLGGGLEFSLTASYRVASESARLGLPETKLGIYPGWGGTIRLPRVIGTDTALEWIATGGTFKPQAALDAGVVDALVSDKDLVSVSIAMIKAARQGQLPWKARQLEKCSPLKLISPIEETMIFDGGLAFIAGQAGPHYPAPVEAIKAMKAHAGLTREEASAHEIAGFVKIAKTSTAESLVTIFLADAFNKKKSKTLAEEGNPVRRVGVLGAGIMGGGIAYQTASSGLPVLLKDITDKALEIGLREAARLLVGQLERKKISPAVLAGTMGAISASLSFGDFDQIEFVVEAVVENEAIKKSVLAEVEKSLPERAILASNTSTISITRLAEGLKRPENFCGMHFFNPVHKMPLVEIIRGEKTSDRAIATTVALAVRLGKTPIVVNDCPGFLVNRVLFPYFNGFSKLLADGVPYPRIDKVMEKWGWPMGPAYLIDVIGIDTAVHAAAVMATGFPDRMAHHQETPMDLLKMANRLGQKNGMGFYNYSVDKKGKPQKTDARSQVDALLTRAVTAHKDSTVTDQDIIDRMMLPMIFEGIRCLDAKIVETPMELDLAVIYGLGFPPFRGGLLKWADQYGLQKLVARAATFSELGLAYQAPSSLEMLAKAQKRYYDLTPG